MHSTYTPRRPSPLSVRSKRAVPEHRPPPALLNGILNPRMGRNLMLNLPAELIVKICEFMVETEIVRDLAPWKVYRRYKKWLPAASACKLWRDVTKGAPSLWRTIDVGSTGSALTRSIEVLPTEATVDITFHDPAPIPQAMRTLGTIAHRIERLIVVELDMETLRSLSKLFWWSPMPMLKEVWMNTVPRNWYYDFGPHFKSELVPNLQAVHQTHLRFNWGSKIIPNLRAISLGPSPGQDRSRIDDFLKVMAKCSRLEFLKIDRAFPIRGEDQGKLSIVLPQLRRVHLTADDPREVLHVLSHIHFDPSVNIDVHILIEVHGSEDPFARTGILSAIPQDAACLPILRTATRAVVRDFNFECWGPQEYGRLALTFDYIKASKWQYTVFDHAKDFGDLLRNAPLEEFAIHKEWSQPLPSRDLGCLLRKFPHVTSFEYSGLKTAQTNLANVLVFGSGKASSSVQPAQVRNNAALPRLRALRLTRTAWDQYFIIGLRDALRTRYMAGLVLDDLEVDFGGRKARFTKQDNKLRTRDAEEDLKQLVRGSVRVQRG